MCVRGRNPGRLDRFHTMPCIWALCFKRLLSTAVVDFPRLWNTISRENEMRKQPGRWLRLPQRLFYEVAWEVLDVLEKRVRITQGSFELRSLLCCLPTGCFGVVCLSHWILTCESRVVIKKWHEVKSLKIHGKQRWEEEIHSKTYWFTLSLWHKQSNHLKAQVHRWPPPLSFPRVLWGNSNAMQENLMLSTLAWGLRMAWPGFLEPGSPWSAWCWNLLT